MNLNAAARLRLEKDVIVRIQRNLQGKGTINVLPGQQVSPSDIIGRSSVASGFRIVKLAEILGVSPSEVEKYMSKHLGERIYKGELLAAKNDGLFRGKKIVESPTDGILDFLNPQSGELRITFMPQKIDLPSGVFGIVDAIDSQRGRCIIRTQANIIYGVFGTGRLRDGILNVIGERDELVGKSLVSPKLSGQILAGGSLIFREAISNAISGGVSGIITGGINAGDYKSMAGGRLIFPKKLDTDMGVSLVVCEGFGSVAIAEDIYDTLLKYNSKFVTIDGNAGKVYLPSFESKCIDKIKKTNLGPIGKKKPNVDQYDGQLLDLKPGLRVRIIGNSYLGEQGKILSIDQTETVIPSGIKTFMAAIETKRHKFQVPVANLEVIDYSL